MSAEKSFLGVPIIGDTHRGHRMTAQRPVEEFRPLVQALLDDPFFVEFGWTQYTPYFNDGDTCVFSAHGLWVRTVKDAGEREVKDADEDDYDDYDEDDTSHLDVEYGNHPTLGWYDHGPWNEETRSYGPKTYAGARQRERDLADALSDAIDGGEFDHVLLELFGDHCSVRITREKIVIQEYSHD